jgi:hypothetical protein
VQDVEDVGIAYLLVDHDLETVGHRHEWHLWLLFIVVAGWTFGARVLHGVAFGDAA